jgi:hypothetical protein
MSKDELCHSENPMPLIILNVHPPIKGEMCFQENQCVCQLDEIGFSVKKYTKGLFVYPH